MPDTPEDYSDALPFPVIEFHKIPASVLKCLLPVQLALSGSAAAKGGKNPHLKNNYATLNDVLQAVMEVASESGLVVVQFPMAPEPRKAGVVTVIACAETGEQFSFNTIVNIKEDSAQGYGSGLTYAARYAMMRFFMLKTEEVKAMDDDGNAASGVTGPRGGYSRQPHFVPEDETPGDAPPPANGHAAGTNGAAPQRRYGGAPRAT